MVKFLFFVHTITEAKQSNRQRRARLVDLPARSFDLARPGVAPPMGISVWTQSHFLHKTRFFMCTLFREPGKFVKITGRENSYTVAFQCNRKQKRQNYGVQNNYIDSNAKIKGSTVCGTTSCHLIIYWSNPILMYSDIAPCILCAADNMECRASAATCQGSSATDTLRRSHSAAEFDCVSQRRRTTRLSCSVTLVPDNSQHEPPSAGSSRSSSRSYDASREDCGVNSVLQLHRS